MKKKSQVGDDSVADDDGDHDHDRNHQSRSHHRSRNTRRRNRAKEGRGRSRCIGPDGRVAEEENSRPDPTTGGCLSGLVDVYTITVAMYPLIDEQLITLSGC
ncbi:hypothetical protein HS088_TW15G01205 [Tripterygium wilfordii]|uniref:Uncharacterized protein n=1 Tax=Tripterygium wilfordii TaxID=458696 RepID=A0A7J7CNM4_TRIWF|nr:hypothetical protein HS088_TW15G01205 [Tripterygium wilfordii]